MNTMLDDAIGQAEITETKIVTGPRNGTRTEIQFLSDGRRAFITPDVHGYFPRYLFDYVPDGQIVERCGGTTYAWNGWITVVATHKITYLYNGKPSEKLFASFDSAKNHQYMLKMDYNADRFSNVSEIIEIIN